MYKKHFPFQKGTLINVEFSPLLAFCTPGEAVDFPNGSMDEYMNSLKNLAKDRGMPDYFVGINDPDDGYRRLTWPLRPYPVTRSLSSHWMIPSWTWWETATIPSR